MDETLVPFDLKLSLIFYIPTTQNGMDESQVPFDLKVSFMYLLLRQRKMEWMRVKFHSTSKCHSCIFYSDNAESSSIRPQSVIHVSFTPTTQNGMDESQVPSTSSSHSCIFYIPTTQNGRDETQVPFDVSFTPTIQNGIDETQVPFDLKLSLLRSRSVICRSFTPENKLDETQVPFDLKVELMHPLDTETQNGLNKLYERYFQFEGT
jgi:hypothetical protein